ncbi:MAG: zinc-binding dehydrogenase [Anaerolineae bacterium]
MKAKAAILQQFNEPLVVEKIEIPPLSQGQMLVQVEAAGVCGSDVHMWRGKDPRTPLPMILGHEGVGRVVDIKVEKRDIHDRPVDVGDLILWERGVTCGICYYCTVLHEPALCPHRWVYGISRSCEEPPYLNACYATHVILDPHTAIIPLENVKDPARYVAASCSGATAAHSFALSPVQVGDTVVILGPGPLGAFCVALARADGAERVVIIGGTKARLALCRNLGATHILNRHEGDPSERREIIHDLTHGRGADLVVEASGSVAAAHEGLGLVRPGGALSLVGFGTPVGEMTLSPFEQVVRKNVRVQGVWVSDVRHTLRAVSLVRQREAAFAELVTHRFSLDEATTALEAVARREAMKAVLIPDESQGV